MGAAGAGIPPMFSDILYSRKFSPGENFRLFRQARRGRNFFRRIILPSENFVTLEFLHAQIFIHGYQAVLVVPHD